MNRVLPLLSVLFLALRPFIGAAAQDFQRYDVNYEDLGKYNPAAAAEARKQISFLGKYGLGDDLPGGDNPLDLAIDLYASNDKGNFMIGGLLDGYSYYERYQAYMGYAWKVQLGTGYLNMGASVNIAMDQADLTKLPSYIGDRDALTFITEDFDLGLEYRSGGLHAGLACRNILSSHSEWEGETFLKNPRTFIANLSYDMVTRGNEFQFSPFLLGGYSRELFLDAGAFVSICQIVNMSYAFRLKDYRHIASCHIPVPATHFALRGAYTWTVDGADSSLTGGIIYYL